jgi:hypothetical protein
VLRHLLDFIGDVSGQRRRLVLHDFGSLFTQPVLEALAAAFDPPGVDAAVEQARVSVFFIMPQRVVVIQIIAARPHAIHDI